MSNSLAKFISILLRSGLVSESQLAQLCDHPTADGGALAIKTISAQVAQQLADSGHLTDYQRAEVLQGKADNLILGEYLILDQLGQGGMGQVYRARHSLMRRDVAVKFTLPAQEGKSPAAAVERFKREVEAVAKLTHPNIVNALDAGHRGELCYLVMEYIRGQNLARIVRSQGPMSFADALHTIVQAADGLEYAHKMGVVHRDIKPSNLLRTDDGVVKILDMGLALLRQPESSEADLRDSQGTEPDHLTRRGQVLGTVEFMAPEQALSPHDADGRADIYSLGCTLYYLLTGKVPYRSADGTVVSCVIAHREQPIPRLCEDRPDVPASFEPVFQKMLAKDARHRYQQMSELVKDLRQAQLRLHDNAETLNETRTLDFDLEKPRPKGMLMVLGAAAVVIASVVGLSLSGYGPFAAGRGPGPVAATPGGPDIEPGKQPASPGGARLLEDPQHSYDLLESPEETLEPITPGPWELSPGRLVIPGGQGAAKCIFRAAPAEAYRLTIKATRLTDSDGPLVVVLRSPNSKSQFFVLVDRNGMTGIGRAATRDIAESTNNLTLRPEAPHTLEFQVAAGRFSLHIDGEPGLAWSGDLNTLTLGAGWTVPHTDAFMVGSNDDASFQIDQLELTPLEPS